MLNEKNLQSQDGSGIHGGLESLAEQLGVPGLEMLSEAGAAARIGKIQTLVELRGFLAHYLTDVLAASEFPVICRAHAHASLGHARELIALDSSPESRPSQEPLARASRHVGRAQLRKLRCLKDHRCVQRYLAAVDAGEASAWHTVVFGVVLSLYSLPLRQGLQHYATQTVGGFINASAGTLGLRREECDALLGEMLEALPGLIENAIRTSGINPRLLPCS
jgi:urease accessory protein UreF